MKVSDKKKKKKNHYIIPYIANKFQYCQEEIIGSCDDTIDCDPPIQNNTGRKRNKSNKPYMTKDFVILNEDMFISDYQIINPKPIIIDNKKPRYITKKTSIGSILQKHTRDNYLEILDDVIRRTNIIVFHTYNFLKLYLIHQFDTKYSMPNIDKVFLSNIMKIVSTREETRGRKSSSEATGQMAILKDFFNKHYKPLINDCDIVSDEKLCFILQSECIGMITNIETNIKEHYIQHVNKFVDASFQTKKLFRDIQNDRTLTLDQKKIKKSEIWKTFNKVKNDILNSEVLGKYDFTSDTQFHDFIMMHKPCLKEQVNPRHRRQDKPFITPMKQKYLKDNLAYDVKANPMDYLQCMFVINRELNEINKEIIKKAKESDTKPYPIKLFHPVPLRTSIVPKYITLDTASIVNIFPLKDKTYYFGKFDFLADEIWSKVFTLNNKAFHWKKLRYLKGKPLCKEYTFNYLLKTDGVACSILFTKVDKYNRPIPEKKLTKPMRLELKKANDFPYIEEIEMTSQTKKYFNSKTIVCVDPGHDDLSYCKGNKPTDKMVTEKKTRKENLKQNRFRYTRAQRDFESKNSYYKRAEDRVKKSTLIGDKSIKEVESELTLNNSRTTIMTEFKEYVMKKTKMNNELRDHYEQHLYRRRKFNRYINTQRSESHMIRNFGEKYGSKDEVVIIYGDYNQKTSVKGKEPAITTRQKNLFRKNGYDTYKINECMTSKICNKCKHETENFLEVIDEDGNKSMLWKLIRCKKSSCLTIHNRDENATRNMHHIVNSLLKGKGRPKEYDMNPVDIAPMRGDKISDNGLKTVLTKKLKELSNQV